jgi:hypothetical protein
LVTAFPPDGADEDEDEPGSVYDGCDVLPADADDAEDEEEEAAVTGDAT